MSRSITNTVGDALTESHDRATTVVVGTLGHLFVQRYEEAVAVYAPGRWVSADVDAAED